MDLFELRARDFGPFQDVTLPLYNQGLVWVTGENHDTKAATNNGSAKSHLFKALGWCLYGESIDSYKGDKVIRRGAKEAIVEIKFGDDPAKPWVLTRSRKKGTPRLKLVNAEGTEHDGNRDEIQARVIEMVGLDWIAFRNTVLYGQGDMSRFALPTTKDPERKEVLHRVLRTGILKVCHELVKNQASEQRKAVKKHETEAEAARARIEEHDLEALQESHDEWDNNRDDDIGALKRDAREWKKSAEAEMEPGDDEEDVAELESEVGRLEAVAEDGRIADIEMEKLEPRIEKSVDANRERAHDADRAQDLVDDLEAGLEKLDTDLCPVCTTPMNEGHAAEHVGKMRKESAKAETERDKAEKMRTKSADLAQRLRVKRKALNDRVRTGREAADEMAEVRERIAATKLADAEAETRAQHAIEMARDKIKQAKAKAAEANPYASRLKEATQRVKELTKQAESMDEQATETRNDLAHLEFWSRGFSNQGLPSFILDAVMPYLTERANHYLGTLADGDITMEFTTQRELKSSKGDYRDEINIAWSVEGVDDYPPSGGQMKKMELATDFALMDLMATREGGHLSILMLDEVLDGLDSEGRQRVLMLLQELRVERGTIFVISHDTDMSEIFEKSVTVVKRGGISKLEMAA